MVVYKIESGAKEVSWIYGYTRKLEGMHKNSVKSNILSYTHVI
jgi:hypothetical protein